MKTKSGFLNDMQTIIEDNQKLLLIIENKMQKVRKNQAEIALQIDRLQKIHSFYKRNNTSKNQLLEVKG